MGKFCSNCGSPVDENQDVCLNCGKSLNYSSKQKNVMVEKGNTTIFGVLGFFIPLAGLILFVLWKDERPKAGKAAITGAVIGFILAVCFGVLLAMAAATVGM